MLIQSHIKVLKLFYAVLFITAINTGGYSQQITKQPGLKDYYANYFPIGVAVSPQALKSPEQANLIIKHFNSITPENAMKMGPIHPVEDRFYWNDADMIVSFAQSNGLKIRGHALCWHEQTPSWLFIGVDGKQVSKTVLLQRLKTHIDSVVGRYKGKVYAWDVVNEAIDDDSTKFLRNSLWYQICGEDFIVKAFEYAHAADPNAVLFYNDYNTERSEKRERVYQLLKKLLAKKVPVHAVGLQAHWSVFEPSQKELSATIEKFASLGIRMQITELDVSVYPWEKQNRALRPGESDVFTDDMADKQARQYKMIFDQFRQYKNVITGVTFWNISDRHTWLDNYPVKGRKNYPLLFDTQLQPKKAFWEVVNFK
ncbi:endo-1,4-beta-xylanase [Mucilaginibacter sp. UR6-1]|uniref:endo-1,4-beta-xylanase n=1 Tax=Mucilaginibacter sp. UR6-1 TaxID=1435643 RepID=UPI001E4322DB|nr:endo-1,4-beta-xylanase [Mucilaginibacter sp. UR6-1]MCC8411269.1 endo-1,4-beta-xylanase [Mucilaginibacter sp. UR6-1]